MFLVAKKINWLKPEKITVANADNGSLLIAVDVNRALPVAEDTNGIWSWAEDAKATWSGATSANRTRSFATILNTLQTSLESGSLIWMKIQEEHWHWPGGLEKGQQHTDASYYTTLLLLPRKDHFKYLFYCFIPVTSKQRSNEIASRFYTFLRRSTVVSTQLHFS